MNLKYPIAVIGSQWGDEGKGKIVDLLASEADIVVRFNGGNNAGHSVVLNGEKFKLSLLPSGVLQKKVLCIAQGEVIDPFVLLEEISFFEKRKIKVHLLIDPRVNIVMPYHKELDGATEAWKGKKATGSLKLGIGYCYEDRNNRAGIRFEDLINPKILKEKIDALLPLKIKQIEKVFDQKTNLNALKIYEDYKKAGILLKKYLFDVSLYIYQNTKDKKIIFEGAHGTFLDANFGTYPYTTAVNTISGAVFPSVGIPPQKIYTLGIVKAYTTRVGNGPFPTELLEDIGERIRQEGGEFGTVSKRPRRCGWLDIPLLKTASRLSGFDYLAVTKLDVLSILSQIKICTHYSYQNKKLSEVPAEIGKFAKLKPVYKTFKGWKKDISKITKWADLPQEAKIYLKYIEKELNVPIKIISVGADRNSNIII